MIYRWILALHIISVISWMAGILYLFRLFVYHAEETEELVKSRFRVMEEKLSRIIVLPAALASLFFGVWMLSLNPVLIAEPWMRAKLLAVAGLFFVTHLGIHFRRALASGQSRRSGRFFRVLNEIPTVLMVLIVIFVIIRPWS